MEDSIVLGLIQNTAILLTLSLFYDYTTVKVEQSKSLFAKIITGIVLGIFGIILVFTPWTLSPGLVFDTRSIMLSISGLFFGSVPTIVAMIITGSYRVIVGGDGMYMGIAVIISSGTVGIIWRKFRFSYLEGNNIFEMLFMGIVVHILMLSCTVFLPTELIWQTLKKIALPVIIIYPLGTMLLGWLFLKRSIFWKTKEALTESEKKFRKLVTSMNDVVFLFDKNKNITYYHAQNIAQLYSEPENFLGKKINDVVPINVLLKFEEAFLKVQNNKSFAFDYNLELNDKKHWFSAQLSPMFKENEFDGALAIVRDITELKQAELTIKESSKQWQDTFKSTADAIMLIDKNQKIQNANNSFLKIYNLNIEDVKGKKCWEIVHNSDEGIEGCPFKCMSESLVRESMEFQFDDKFYLISTDPIFNEKGELNGAIHIMRDISIRKRVEIELREQLKRNDEILNSTMDGYILADDKGKIIKVNPAYCKIIGYSKNELESMNISQLEMKVAKDELQRRIEQMIQKGSDRFETKHKYKDGRPIDLSVSISIIKEGKSTFVAAFVRDITEQKLAEQEIKEKGQFIESIVNLSPNIIYIYDIVEQKNIFSNKGIELILGYVSEEVLQMGEKLLPILMHPDDFKTYLHDTYPKYKNTRDYEIIQHQYRMKHKLGHWCWFECFEIIYLRDLEGVPKQVLGVVYDITEMKNIEANLKKATQLLKETGKIAKIGGWEFDPETGKGSWTEEVARIHDLEPNEPTNMEKGVSFYTKESKKRIEKAIKNAITKKQSYNLELEFKTAKGVNKWVRSIGTPVVVGNKVVKIRGSFQDITNEKNSEMELHKHRDHLEELVKERTEELEATLKDVERMNKLFTGREIRIKELKNKISELEKNQH